MRLVLVVVLMCLFPAVAPGFCQETPPEPTTRAFAAPPPASEDYLIGPNDLLEIKVFELQQLDRTVRVTSDGMISLPLLGEVAVGGLTERQAEQAIAQQLRVKQFVRDPQVSVFVQEYVSRRVFVQGAVSKPGIVNLLGTRTLLDIIGEAGGLMERAGKRIFVVRPFSGKGGERIEVDGERLVYEADPAMNIQMQPGDIVMIPYEQEYHVFVNGAVARPGAVDYKSWEQMTVLQAVTAAGGGTDRANESKVQVIRRHDNGAKEIFKVNLKRIKHGKAEDMILHRNDIVVVPESFF